MNKEHEIILKDRQAREDIRTCLDETLMVEAGAGTGKTSCLVDRMVALIAEDRCAVGSIAAITFTRKAAGELEERFQLKLEAALGKATDQQVADRLFAALANLDSAYIGTIHSFCSRILRERPVEAGINPEFSEIEGVEEKILCNAAWDDYLFHAHLEEGQQKLGMLTASDLSPEDLRGAFETIATYPDVTFTRQAMDFPELGPLKVQLKQFCSIATRHLPPVKTDKGWDGLQTIAAMALRWEKIYDLYQTGDRSSDLILLRLAGKMNRSPAITKNRWSSDDDRVAVENAYYDLRNRYIIPVLHIWWEYRHYYILEFLLPAAEHYRELRRQAGRLNFQDLLMLTASLLRNNPEVRQYFQERFTHILVDEFQDTDPIQAEIMLYLTGTDLNETNWTALNPRPGSLFVVGDPKQSIYRFRRADIAIYNQIKAVIEKNGGRVLFLTTNFRSRNPLIRWNNEVFTDLLPAQKDRYQADFVTMDEAVEGTNSAPDSGISRMVVDDVKGNNKTVIAQQDARQIGAWIASALQGSIVLNRSSEEKEQGLTDRPTPGDFMIILRYKKNMSQYARELERLGIPYRITGQSDIAGTVAISELLLVLQALADPHNPVCLVAALRGTFFGVSDDLLYRFKQAGGRFNFLSAVPECANLEVVEVFQPIWEKLTRLWDLANKLPPSSAYAMTASELGLIPLLLAGELGQSKVGYYYQLLEHLRASERNGKTLFPEAVEFIGRMIEEGFEDELDITGGTTPAVRIMNLHKVKGLEAPVVFLANPGHNISREPEIHINRVGGSSQGYLEISKEGLHASEVLAQSLGWINSYQGEEVRFRQAEEMRLLYVAATRAKNYLLVSTYPKKEDASAWVALNCYLPDGELAVQPVAADAYQASGIANVTPCDLETVVKQIKDSSSALAVPSYEHMSVTAIKSQAAQLPDRKEAGFGTQWGTVIHAAFKLLISGKGGHCVQFMEMKLLEILEQEGLEARRLEDVLKIIEKFKAGDLWPRIASSPEKYLEIPFGLWEESLYTTGIIDLAFREQHGWVIVDYKTDRIADQEHLEQLINYYHPQVELYRRHFETITNERVVEALLYFTDII
ncbi:MAG TPA: UvrD-helicase domain-containing protein [Candidatus Limnocylindrales bacterium]|nr:UvrD-helicase domain-containing protein [Candidatus Limnocylindrales bacterium]